MAKSALKLKLKDKRLFYWLNYLIFCQLYNYNVKINIYSVEYEKCIYIWDE